MGLCVLYYVEYSLFNVKKVGFFYLGWNYTLSLLPKGHEKSGLYGDGLMLLTHSHTMKPFDTRGKQAF